MKKYLVTGARGMLGSALVPILRRAGAGQEVETYLHGDDVPGGIEITNAETVRSIVRDQFKDWSAAGMDAAWIVNCAAFTDVDGAEQDEARAMAVNRDGVANLVRAADEFGVRLLHISTDYVFGGTQGTRTPRPWRETDPVAPQGVYARSKRAGEEVLLASHGRHLLVRTSWLFGAGGRNFIESILERARSGGDLAVVDDQRGSPTYATDLAGALEWLMDSDATGIYHAANAGECTWYDLACEALHHAGLASVAVARTTTAALGRRAPRPAYSVLDTGRLSAGHPMPSWKDAVKRYLQAYEGRPVAS